MAKKLLLYLDANVYLDFYSYTDDDLDQLTELAKLVKKRRVALIVPEQTEDEFHRKREKTIAASLRELRKQNLRLKFPRICSGYPELKDLEGLQRAYDETHAALLKKISSDAHELKLKADSVIRTLFKRGSEVPASPAILERARLRVERGNPPGKKGQLGDAINWESLLQDAPDDEDLHLVTTDKDFASPLSADQLLPFLATEWTERKDSTVFFYRRLSAFLKARLPEIQLSEQQERAEWIDGLVNSNSFAETHTNVAPLLNVSELTPSEAEQILSAAITNDQIYWIIGDGDVNRLVRKVREQYADSLSDDLLNAVDELLAQ